MLDADGRRHAGVQIHFGVSNSGTVYLMQLLHTCTPLGRLRPLKPPPSLCKKAAE